MTEMTLQPAAVRGADPRGAAERSDARHPAPADHPVSACERYFRAVRARDLEAVLDAMTPNYGRGLRAMRNDPDFPAFFQVWCDTQGRRVTMLASTVDGDAATVLLDAGRALVQMHLVRSAQRWRVDAEDVQLLRNGAGRRWSDD